MLAPKSKKIKKNYIEHLHKSQETGQAAQKAYSRIININICEVRWPLS